MSKYRNAILIGVSLALGACGGTDNRGVESVHQPVVSRTDYVFDVNAAGGSIEGGEAQRLAGWFRAIGLGYGDHVAIDNAGSYGDEGVRSAVANLVARYGLLLDDTAPVTAGQIAPGSVRVVVSRQKASVPGCPDWSRSSTAEFNSHSMSNYGCATNSNLAAMIANPEDLVQGQRGDPVTNADVSSKAIKTYREQANTGKGGLKSEGSSK